MVEIDSPTRYEVSWFIPEDNGEPLDFFEVTFFPVVRERQRGAPKVRDDGTNISPNDRSNDVPDLRMELDTDKWKRVGNVFRNEIPYPGNVRYEIKDLYPDTYHMLELRAHNKLGFSPVTSMVIKTAKGKEKALSLYR